jgi:hypothetical protein
MAHQQARRMRVPVVYGGAVVLLLLAGLAFRGFSFEVGDARVAGRYAFLPLLGTGTVDSLTFTWNGLSLRFSRGTTPALAGFEKGEDADDILLSDGSRLHLVPGSDPGGSLTIQPEPGAGSLSIPYALAGVATDAPAGTDLAWRAAGTTFVLALPASARVDTESGTITLKGTGAAVLSRAGTAAVAAATVPAVVKTTTRTNAVASRLPDEKDLPGADKLQAVMAGWTDAVWAGLSGPRFSAGDGTWSLPGGSRGISDELGVAYLAESVARGTWKDAFSAWSDAAAAAHARGADTSFSFTTSAFTGGTRDYAGVAAKRTAAIVDKARGLLAAGDLSVFTLPDMVPVLRAHGSPELLAAARTLAAGKAAVSLALPDALGLDESLIALAQESGTADALRTALRASLTKVVIPALRTTASGLFLAGSTGTVDVATSIRCGALLVEAGAFLPDSRTAALGRGLLVAALGLADPSGVMPAALRLSGSTVAGSSGKLAPEAVYAELPVGRRLPREISIASALGAGVTLFTAADPVTVEKTDTEVRIVFGYPAGVPHHFAITGLGPFGQVTVHGIPWHADPSYARYSDGWTYDPAARVFYGKLTGRTAQEEIHISF